jgi:Spy/CpxP family protein refolding chaperone
MVGIVKSRYFIKESSVNVPRSLLAAIFSLSLAAPIAASAQQAPPQQYQQNDGAYGHNRRNGFMRELRALNLNDQQKAQIKQIVTQFRQAHPRGSAPDPQAREQMRAQVMSVLTPAQRQQLQQEMAQSRAAQGTPNR